MIKFKTQTINKKFAIEKLGRKCPALYSGQEINLNKVKTFSMLMKEKLWVPMDHDSPISFNESGELMNGQHRLLAIIESDSEIEELIAYNVPDAIIESHGIESKDGVNNFIWGCSEFILDFINVKTRNNSLIRRIYDNIYEKAIVCFSDCVEENRKNFAFVVAIMCAVESAVDINEIEKRIATFKNSDCSIPEDFFLLAYKHLANIKMDFIRPPIYNFLPNDIYKAVIRNG